MQFLLKFAHKNALQQVKKNVYKNKLLHTFSLKYFLGKNK